MSFSFFSSYALSPHHSPAVSVETAADDQRGEERGRGEERRGRRRGRGRRERKKTNRERALLAKSPAPKLLARCGGGLRWERKKKKGGKEFFVCVVDRTVNGV